MPAPNDDSGSAVPEPPRGALLYVPGDRRRMIRKAASRGADVLVLDLEDGVHPSRKDAARTNLAEARAALAAGGAAVALRVNAPETAGGRRDLEAARGAGFDAVVLPKAERREAVRRVRARLGPGTPIWLMIETAGGAAAVFRLAAERGVGALVFGSADYRLGVGALATPEERELDFVRGRLLLAARAARIGCWDAPWFAFRDLEGLRRSARRAFELGFDGKSAVHPGQLPVIREAFRPGPTRRRWAERVVRAMEEAGAAGKGVAELDGELLEELHLRQARRLLALGRKR